MTTVGRIKKEPAEKETLTLSKMTDNEKVKYFKLLKKAIEKMDDKQLEKAQKDAKEKLTKDQLLGTVEAGEIPEGTKDAPAGENPEKTKDADGK